MNLEKLPEEAIDSVDHFGHRATALIELLQTINQTTPAIKEVLEAIESERPGLQRILQVAETTRPQFEKLIFALKKFQGT